MSNQTSLTASSCVVENKEDGARLTLTFMNFAEYNAARETLAPAFAFDMSDPKKGGCVGGSKLVALLPRDSFAAAVELISAFHIRRGIEFLNGSRQPCNCVAQAIGMAFNHE